MENGRGMLSRLRAASWLPAAILAAAPGCFAMPQACSSATATYNGYKAVSVRIRNPIGFISPWASSSLGHGLQLQPGTSFSVKSFNEDTTYLSAALKSGFSASLQKVKLSYVGGEILDCDPENRTLRVVYPLFTSVIPSLLAPSIEEQAAEVQRPATTGATRASSRRLWLTPFTGYNQTRGATGGLNFAYTARRLQMRADAGASADSLQSYLDLGGELGPANRLWSRARWAGALEYADLPAGSGRFKEGKLAARFSASTADRMPRHALLRYGASLEGGHQQSSHLAAGEALPPDSSYGSMKLYAGVTGRPRNSAFSASYGFQLGDTFSDHLPLFSKHLLDLGYNVTLPVPYREPLGDRDDFKGPIQEGVHRSLGLETRLGAGLIHNLSGAPLAERFLGGNEIRPFVPDASWVILANPFIRSIPENRLGALSGAQLGGSRFYSVNATAFFTVWGRPLLPKDLTVPGTGFPEILNAPFHTAALALANTYKTKHPDYIRLSAGISAQAAALKERLLAFSDTLKQIPAAIAAQPAIAEQIQNVKGNLVAARAAAGLIVSQPDPQVTDQLVTGTLPALSSSATSLKESLQSSSLPDLAARIDSLISDVNKLGGEIRDSDQSLPSAKFEDQAWRALAPGHRAIDVFLHDLNIYSLSPVAIFDAARVWPVSQGIRYAIGPGLRLSLVNANFTVAYGFNPHRAAGEDPGAISFKLEITSLF